MGVDLLETGFALAFGLFAGEFFGGFGCVGSGVAFVTGGLGGERAGGLSDAGGLGAVGGTVGTLVFRFKSAYRSLVTLPASR